MMRPLASSRATTSVKDPSLRDTLFVEELIGPETISTMREETIRAFQDHGRIEPRLETDLNEAQYLFNQLYAIGVNYDDASPRSNAKASTSSSPPSTACSNRSARSAANSPRPPRLPSDASGARWRGSTCHPG